VSRSIERSLRFDPPSSVLLAGIPTFSGIARSPEAGAGAFAMFMEGSRERSAISKAPNRRSDLTEMIERNCI
jgi:hypothetical protein